MVTVTASGRACCIAVVELVVGSVISGEETKVQIYALLELLSAGRRVITENDSQSQRLDVRYTNLKGC
jgi:hypothetical protein